MAQDYVYTTEAARKRFSRGAKSVLIFVPYQGRLLRATPKTLDAVRRRIQRIVKQEIGA